MSQSSNPDPISCNRQPFLSEDGCDRGSVDIHRFDELPYCGDIDPTPPDIPPEIVDTPINIPVPPPCACFNIDYDMNLKYSGTRKFRADAEFRANGDCCEGNYVSEFNLQIPCPIVKTDKKTIQVGIGYGRGAGRKKLTYINENANSCTIRPENVDMELEIPCPIGETGSKSIQVGIGYGRGAGKRRQQYIRENADRCTVHPYNVDMNLEIPCPVNGIGGPKSITANVNYANYRRHNEYEVKADFINTDPGGCAFEPNDVTLNMDIPCPFSINGDCGKVKLRRIVKGEWSSYSVCIAELKSQTECELVLSPITLDIPCPIRLKKKKSRNLKATIKWGEEKSASADVIEVSSCDIVPKEARLDLQIPCPIKRNKNIKLKINNQTKVIGTLNSSSCNITLNDASFNIPFDGCNGVENNGGALHFGALSFGDPTPVHKQILTTGGCGVGIDENVTFSLNVPCAIRKNRLKIDLSTEWISAGSFSWGNLGLFMSSDSSSGEAGCTRRMKIKAKLPKSIGGDGGGGMFAWDSKTHTMGPGGAMVCGSWHGCSGYQNPTDGTYVLEVSFSNGSPSLQVVKSGSAAQGSVTIPIYTISGGKITTDLRGAFVVQCWE